MTKRTIRSLARLIREPVEVVKVLRPSLIGARDVSLVPRPATPAPDEDSHRAQVNRNDHDYFH